MIEWYWLGVAFTVGFLLHMIIRRRRIGLRSTIEAISGYGYKADSLYEMNMSRHKDFHSVLYSTERGKRVLSEILNWGHLYTSMRGNDPYKIAYKNGENSLALKILTAVHAEPNEPPKQTKVQNNGR